MPLSVHTRFLHPPCAQKIQTARASIPKSLSWVFGLFRLSGTSAATGSQSGQDWWQEYLPSLRHDRRRGLELFWAGGVERARGWDCREITGRNPGAPAVLE